jgi:hypothetical protein
VQNVVSHITRGVAEELLRRALSQRGVHDGEGGWRRLRDEKLITLYSWPQFIRTIKCRVMKLTIMWYLAETGA